MVEFRVTDRNLALFSGGLEVGGDAADGSFDTAAAEDLAGEMVDSFEPAW